MREKGEYKVKRKIILLVLAMVCIMALPVNGFAIEPNWVNPRKETMSEPKIVGEVLLDAVEYKERYLDDAYFMYTNEGTIVAVVTEIFYSPKGYLYQPAIMTFNQQGEELWYMPYGEKLPRGRNGLYYGEIISDDVFVGLYEKWNYTEENIEREDSEKRLVKID